MKKNVIQCALIASCMILAGSLFPAFAAPSTGHPGEQLGVVDFPVSCAPATQAAFNRGVALLHSFWYEEAEVQFADIAKQDPPCAMAHWGSAMSVFYQIWERPDAATQAKAWQQMEHAQALLAKEPAVSPRERQYVTNLSTFFAPGNATYETRIAAYSADMAKLHAAYPDDVDAASFYALSLLAATPNGDLSLTNNRAAMVVLTPLFTKYPDHPGVQHYIIHSCDTPALAGQGLAAAEKYEVTAASVPHGVHMPGHIYSRLGMWQEDIRANRAAVADSQLAERQHQGGVFDQLHADDFLLYAYLQSADDVSAKALIENNPAVTDHLSALSGSGMATMVPMYRVKLPLFYDLEMRDWNAALAFTPPAGKSAMDKMPGMDGMVTAMNQMTIAWARTIAAGHLQKPAEARAALVSWQKTLDGLRGTPDAYMFDAPSTVIQKNEMEAWAAYAAGDSQKAFATMRAAADEQDKVGQGEVDIPAREMLGDLLLETHHPQEALAAYDAALKLSPGRLNGLYHAGMAAEAVGKSAQAAQYYAALLKSTGDGKQSSRPEFGHARTFLASLPASAVQAEYPPPAHL